MRRWLIFTAALFGAACSSSSSDPRPPSGQQPAPEAAARAVVAGHAQPGTIVVLEPAFAQEFPLPQGSAYMDQSAQTFVPDFVIARTGQPMQFRSSEDILHNVRVENSDTRETVFNVATPPWGSYTHTFTQPGFYNVTCDIHAAMRASILVTASPYTALSGASGEFSFQDVQPGSYRVIGFVDGKRVAKHVMVAAPRTDLSVE
jgi:plastocyanin